MSQLVETIRLENGILQNISYHNERMSRSLFELFKTRATTDLGKIINIPAFALQGIYKCRVVYDDKSTMTEFLPYYAKLVRSLKIVYDDKINYAYKFTDRTAFLRLMELRGDCDDILIIKKGMVTDSSFSNVIFRQPDGKWITPVTCLLKGTRRSNLLENRIIRENYITIEDLNSFTEIRLINAMLGIEDSPGIAVSKIFS
jgi:4-amino-4-deoxychorismate lyase